MYEYLFCEIVLVSTVETGLPLDATCYNTEAQKSTFRFEMSSSHPTTQQSITNLCVQLSAKQQLGNVPQNCTIEQLNRLIEQE